MLYIVIDNVKIWMNEKEEKPCECKKNVNRLYDNVQRALDQ